MVEDILTAFLAWCGGIFVAALVISVYARRYALGGIVGVATLGLALSTLYMLG